MLADNPVIILFVQSLRFPAIAILDLTFIKITGLPHLTTLSVCVPYNWKSLSFHESF
jgi:hypothetical protein